MDYKKLYEEWLEDSYFDEATKAELKAIESDENEIKERFYKELEFGTAGLRGVIGAGMGQLLLLQELKIKVSICLLKSLYLQMS